MEVDTFIQSLPGKTGFAKRGRVASGLVLEIVQAG